MQAVSRGACICQKRQYPSKARARQMAAKVRRDHGHRVEAYHCPFDSRWWHIGHRPARTPVTRALARAIIRHRHERTAS